MESKPKHLFRFKWLLFLFSFLLIPFRASADQITSGQISVTDKLNTDGYLEVRLCHYDSDGSDEGLHSNGNSYIALNGKKILSLKSFNGAGDPQGTDTWYWCAAKILDSSLVARVQTNTRNGEKVVTTEYQHYNFDEDQSAEKTYSTWRIYPSVSFLKSAPTDFKVNVYLRVDFNNGSDYDVRAEKTVNFKKPTIPTLTWDYSTTAGYMTASFNATVIGDKYKFENESVKEIDRTGLIKRDYAISNQPQKASLTYYKKISNYQTYDATGSITLPAYQWPTELVLTEEENCNTTISWTIPKASGDFVSGDEFLIQRSTNVNFSANLVDIGAIAFDNNQTDYSITDYTSEENLNSTYYYRLRRTKTAAQWNWSKYVSNSINLSMAHQYIKSAEAHMEDDRVNIRWEYDDGKVISENSYITIVAYNETGGSQETFKIPTDSLANRSYTFLLSSTCARFVFNMYVTPGNDRYRVQDALRVTNKENIITVKMGKITQINASKGYYSDHVELDWKTDGYLVDVFSIQAREYGSGDDFVQIDQIGGNIASDNYQYRDTKSVPGTVYEYQVQAITSCGEATQTRTSQKAIGFRTPSGDIYGTVAYSSGQAVEGVEVRLEVADSGAGLAGKNYKFASGGYLQVDDSNLLNDVTDAVSLQAWVTPVDGNIIKKSGMYQLGVANGKATFTAGAQTLTSSVDLTEKASSTTGFVHLTGVMSADSLYIYINGKVTDVEARTGTVTNVTNPVRIGGDGFAGYIDEVRIWTRALSKDVIATNFNSYLVGGETGLAAYYTFDYAVANNFYDLSYRGNKYNEHHGTVYNATLTDERIPSVEELGYRAYTGEDGSYTIRAVPYVGNGTSYNIIPRYGSHSFTPTKSLRLVSASSQSHTVNFTDNSSFVVTGTVRYQGGTIPVEGVSFYIDGVIAMDSKSNIILSKADGTFAISVPVGIHEVKAQLSNHEFVNEGKITNSDGSDRNYQDNIGGNAIELWDNTKIRFIGRVAGGTIQEAFEIGHSASTNNLGDAVSLTLTYPNDAYSIANVPVTETLEHAIPSNKTKAETNEVSIKDNTITIYPNKNTGEFVADVFPLNYNVTLNIPGYEVQAKNLGGALDLTNSFSEQTSTRDYRDSTYVASTKKYEYKDYSDEVKFNDKQLYIVRVSPTVDVKQVDGSRELDYFGESKQVVQVSANKYDTLAIFDKDNQTYLFDRPVFHQGNEYSLRGSVYEGYTYYDAAGDPVADKKEDRVPSQNAKVTFKTSMSSESKEVECDDNGQALFSFYANMIDLTTGLREITASASVDEGSSFSWKNPYPTVICTGSVQEGNNFVTAGPNHVMTVLRDPPGSNSYAFLEKGYTISSSSTYSGSVGEVGEENITTGVKVETIVFNGVGTGTIQKVSEVDSEWGVDIEHSEVYNHENSRSYSITTNQRFQTSEDPGYVGADGDVFIGESTNIVYGAVQNLAFVSKERFDAVGAENSQFYHEIDGAMPKDSKYVMVKQTAIGVSSQFATMFAYPQVHIENVLIPNLETLKNSILHQSTEMSESEFQALADGNREAVYVSKLPLDDENYGKSNTDEVFKGDPNYSNLDDGASYKIYYASGLAHPNDTILYLNQTIDKWYEELAKNEEAKVKATDLLNNYSLQAGSPIEYSQEYSAAKSNSNGFVISVTVDINNDKYFGTVGPKTKLEWKEGITTEHGGTWTTESEASHAKGFVLAEDGSDYLSVDVLYEKGDDEESNNNNDDNIIDEKKDEAAKNYYPAFVFRTRGGVTSCPYEPEYVTKYYQPGKHVINQATVQMEKPVISLKSDFIENVPSGSPAYITMYLKNESESLDDCWYNLRLIDDSNPNGAKFTMDGAPFASARAILVPAGEIVQKTLEVTRGVGMDFDNITFRLESQCQFDPTDFQDDIYSEVSFSVHFTPSASPVSIKTPSNNWTYNTQLPTTTVNGIVKHYMPVQITDFDVNYENFYRICFQYKPASGDDNAWTTLMNYYNDSQYYDEAIAKGLNAEMINSKDKGTITYNLFLDDLQDQNYDIRAVASSLINNIEYTKESEVYSGIKDMYNPRLFGSAQPANGILTINDEIRLNFNETIAEGYLTQNNFSVEGIRNGAQTDHSVSVSLDGENDYLVSELSRNWSNKDISVEAWIYVDEAQDATIFSHGDGNEGLELAITKDKHLAVRVGKTTYKSDDPVDFKVGEWSHVALVFDANGYVSAFYNFVAAMNNISTDTYDGVGNIKFGCDVNNGNNLKGKIHNARIWDKVLTSGRLQTNSLVTLSGNESNLIGYYPMDEVRGTVVNDKSRGINLTLEGGEWSLPEAKAAAFDGKTQYARVRTDNAIFDTEMDYTIEFWFKAESDNQNATMISNGRGDGKDSGGSKNLFSVGFEDGVLAYFNNGIKHEVAGNYTDNNWHHFAVAVSRISGRAQILVDGELKAYCESQDLGGVQAAIATLGARGYYMEGNATDLVTDNYFHGSIDEFRMWNLYKNETLISNNMCVHLDGEEMGLSAYYPFEKYVEWQGTQELRFTLEDQTVTDNTLPGIQIVGADNLASSVAAPVKNKGAVSKLDYTFVVNNDALIITLGETWNRIEKTIVTFTVDGVRDLHGNKILNPITWSAYIDRNQLKWDETEKQIELSANEGSEFVVKINNNGGSIEHFNIENLPTWLSATPASGTINPSSSTSVKFQIDNSLNIGTYNEVIYLRGDNDVLEALDLTVKVRAEKPDWTVNPSAFMYNMSVFGKIQINSVYSMDEEDMLAAFVGGTCVGVVNNSYNKINDMYYALLTIYNNEVSVDNLEFRIWDASTGVIYTATPSIPVKFANNGIVGEASAPVIFAANEERVQSIPLNAGWTWISLNVANSKMNDLNALLSGTDWSVEDEVKTENGGFASYTANGWVGTLTSMDNQQMYLVYSNEQNTLRVNGTPVEAKNNILNIEGGKWNYISYIPTSNLVLKEALAGYDAVKGDVIKSQTGFAMYQDNLGWIGSLTYLESGLGYMLQRKGSTDAKLQYPTVASSKSKGAPEKREDNDEDGSLYVKPTSTNMSIVAQTTGFDVEEGDILATYINGELISQTRPVYIEDNDEYIYFITVGCEADGMPIEIALERDGEKVALSKNDIKYIANNISGTISSPVMIELVENASTTIDRIMNDLPDGAEVNIYDANGRKVETMERGVYIININVDGVNNTYKVVK